MQKKGITAFKKKVILNKWGEIRLIRRAAAHHANMRVVDGSALLDAGLRS